MPKIIRLNNYGTLGFSIPKALVEATGLKAGDTIELRIEQVEPEVIIKFRRPKAVW